MKTLDYINFRNSSDGLDEWTKVLDWSLAKELNPLSWINELFGLNIVEKQTIRCQYENDKVKTIIVSYGNENPSLLKMGQTSHDGTLVFLQRCIYKTFEGIIDGSSYSLLNSPKDYEENFFNYIVHYKLGDMLIHSEYLKHLNKEQGKMFPGQRDSIACAIEIAYYPV